MRTHGRVARVLAFASASLLVAGCHRRSPAVAASPAALVEDYCWWTPFHTTLPADTVATRFTRAFASVGLTDTTWSHAGDTAWAHAGPATITRGGDARRYSARVVAYRRGDSTSYRHYLSIERTSSSGAESPNEGALRIPLCGEIGRASQTHGVAAREPDGEEKLGVWTRH